VAGENCLGGGSRLDARGRLEIGDVSLSFASEGTDGTGGMFSGRLPVKFVRLGDGERNVRSAIDPELPGLFGSVFVDPDELLTDPVEFFLTMRFVCTSPTSVGLVGFARNAAAAAAADNAFTAPRLFRKACVAAVVAAEEAGVVGWACLG
jgi:hypothetical protein